MPDVPGPTSNAPAVSSQADGVRTTCPYCGVGCGVVVDSDAAGAWRVRGDQDHPANFGRLCSKGSALGETLGDTGRLLYPEIDGQRVSWDRALNTVADGIARVRDRHGPEAIAFYLSGQLLTEDYQVANKLMKGFLGSANVDTNSRLCMASSVAGHRRAFGADLVPGCYEDLDLADLIVLVGSNAAWCHPVLFQRMVANRNRRGARIVVIDPRRTATAAEADLHLAIRPGSDTALFNGLLVHLADYGALDDAFIDASTREIGLALNAARADAGSIDAVASKTGLPIEQVHAFFDAFACTERSVSCYSQGVHQSIAGTDKVNAIINCHLATGRIGRPGMGPFSLTGQPNAMGGREVGGLANQLAAHMGFAPDEVDRVRRFWNAPSMATHEGLKAVDLFEAIAVGKIRALWVMATNPAFSLPRADAMRDALGELEVFGASDCVASNDTIDRAAIRLPASAWGEKDGTVTNSERRISRQRAFRDPPGEARPDWWIVSQVAHRLGFGEAFNYESPAAIFREHAALTAFENDEARDLDLGGLTALCDQTYENLAPVQWPVRAGSGDGIARMTADGHFFTDHGKARFVPVTTLQAQDRRFTLNTGRIRDQWHTMTRTGTTARLCRHIAEPFVEIHPDDAADIGLEHGALARIRSNHGEAIVRAVVGAEQRKGSLFAPIHWSDANSGSGRIGALVHGLTDPISGQPDSKATSVSLTAVQCAYHGFILSANPIAVNAAVYWSRAPVRHGFATTFALAAAPPGGWRAWLKDLLGASGGDILELANWERQVYRSAVVVDDRLSACCFVSSEPVPPARDWLEEMLAVDVLDADTRRALLFGRATDDFESPGQIVCACFGVGENTIVDAITNGALSSAEDIGTALKAGTNCGSCIPELRRLLSLDVDAKRRDSVTV